MDKFKFQNIFEQFVLWDKSNFIGIGVADFFKQTEKNSEQDKVVVTRVRLLGATMDGLPNFY